MIPADAPWSLKTSISGLGPGTQSEWGGLREPNNSGAAPASGVFESLAQEPITGRSSCRSDFHTNPRYADASECFRD